MVCISLHVLDSIFGSWLVPVQINNMNHHRVMHFIFSSELDLLVGYRLTFVSAAHFILCFDNLIIYNLLLLENIVYGIHYTVGTCHASAMQNIV